MTHIHPALVLLALPAWAIVLVTLWRTRRWLSFYLVGAFGFVVFFVLLMTLTGWSSALESAEASQVTHLAQVLGMSLVVLGSNSIAIKNHTGWGVFDVGIECSAMLEMAALASLVLFYPAVFTPVRKAFIITIGTLLTYLINLLRILFIAVIVASFGTDWVFPAHAVFGRLLFFVLTIALYWRLVTLPTIDHVGASLEVSDE